MARRTFTTAEKRQLAQAWLAARVLGAEDQESFALRNGTTARRVRQWVREYAPPEPARRARDIVIEALHQLHQLLDQLDTMSAKAVDDPAAEESHLGPAPPGTPPPATSERTASSTGAPPGASTAAATGVNTSTLPPSPPPPPRGAPSSRQFWDLCPDDELADE